MNEIALYVGYTTMVLSGIAFLGYCATIIVNEFGFRLHRTLIAAYSLKVVSGQLQALKDKETK